MMSKWYEKQGAEGDVVISTRVRFARNLADYPFPGRQLSPEKQREVVDICAAALAKEESGKDFHLVVLDGISKNERLSLKERHLISQEIVDSSGPRAVLLNGDESISIMINEEDHLRIQVMGAGLCLEDTLKRAIEVDNIFDSNLSYAFDEHLGYLTKCPTNLGAGMRASVMLHLPALTETGAIRALAANAGKLGFAVRGMYGEGSAAKGALYQISNQMALGFTEQTIIERLSDTLSQIIEQERKSRAEIYERDKLGVEDRVWRAAGILKYARSISADEAIGLISEVRFGVSLGLIDISLDRLSALLWEVQPANLLRAAADEELQPAGRDKYRADFLRGAVEPKV